jgi:hypothetical protein
MLTGSSEEKKRQTQETAPKEDVTSAAQTTQQEATAPKEDVTPAQSAGNTAEKSYTKTMETLKKAETTAPTYSGSYDQEINDLYKKITNREPFKYDYASDPLYGQYAEKYQQLGRQAMKDSMGQTAALTGGYGNSYGGAVGQQQYDAYLQRLNDVLPELYSQAYNQYAAEGGRLKEQYSLAANLRDTEYNQYRDSLGDYQYNQAWDAQQAQQKADDLAKYGDFSGYAELYGEDAANRMQTTWAAANPGAAYISGVITADQYYTLTGEYPPGYTPAGGGGGSEWGGSTWEYASGLYGNSGSPGGRWTLDDAIHAAAQDPSWVASNGSDAWEASNALANSGADLGGMTPSQAQQYIHDQLYK